MFSRLQPKRIREARAIAADSILNDFILVVFVSKKNLNEPFRAAPWQTNVNSSAFRPCVWLTWQR